MGDLARTMPGPHFDKLRAGETLIIGSKWYALCAKCDGVSRINKPLLGSFHICRRSKEDETIAALADTVSLADRRKGGRRAG